MPTKTLIVIVGPTAIGKTSFAIDLAKALNTEIISADSRQFYKEMSIGTAVPSKEELEAAKHHFIHSHSIHEPLTAGQYEEQAIALIEELFKRKNTLALVGGSGLYIDAICKGIDDIPSDSTIKKELIKQHKEEGLQPLVEQLKSLDYDYYMEVDRDNPSRVIRALEACLASGESYSSLRQKRPKKRPFNIVKIGLQAEREFIYKRINERVEQMMRQGLLNEVKSLSDFKRINALKTVGYTEIFDYLARKTTLEAAVEDVKKNTRRYAKRQLTWFKRDESVKWFDIKDVALARKYALACANS